MAFLEYMCEFICRELRTAEGLGFLLGKACRHARGWNCRREALAGQVFEVRSRSCFRTGQGAADMPDDFKHHQLCMADVMGVILWVRADAGLRLALLLRIKLLRRR